MSHRNALFASIALTVIMTLGIFASRDHLFQTDASADNTVTPTATAIAETPGDPKPVIEGTLPQPTAPSISRKRDDDETRTPRASGHDDEDDEEQDDD